MTNMLPREIELKLTLPPARVPDFLARMARRRVEPVCQLLHTRYFDTPNFDLSAAGVAVRVRRVGRRWVQTLKTGGERQGGLSTRIEFEMPVTRGEPDWTRFPPEALARVPVAWRAQLVPVFVTRFERMAWQVKGRGGAMIEVALDRGEVIAAPGGTPSRAREPICEIELELKHGAPDALFALARSWAAAWGCLPNDESKAARGVRLAHGFAPAPVKPGALALTADMPVEAGFAAICRHALEQFQANLPGVLAASPGRLQKNAGDRASGATGTRATTQPPITYDIEYLHQARVALRRLRAGLRGFRRVCVLPPDLQAGLKALTAALGPARDWDVLCTDTLPALASHAPDPLAWAAECQRIEAQRAAVHLAMQRALVAAQPGVWLLDMTRWLLRQGWRDDEPARQRSQRQPLGPWAIKRLRRDHRRLVRHAMEFESLSLEARHALRLRFKRQRYALEGFASLLPARRCAARLDRLCAVQDSLGRANDARVARVLLQPGPGEAGPARAFMLGWLVAVENAAGCGDIAKVLKNFVKSGDDW